MDEAERCHRVALLAYGNLLVRGTVPEVIAQARMSTWTVTGTGMTALAQALKGEPGVEQVVPFGGTIHVSGRDAAAIEATLARLCTPGQERARIPSGLEDVFIGLMDSAKDNYN